jgi:ketosteroid isomerase-like protein
MRNALRKSRLAAFGVLTAALLLPPVALARPHNKHQAREQIFALEVAWRKAQITDDVPAMDKLLSDDYLGITTHGDVLTKEQQLDRMRNRKADITHFDASDTKIKLVGQIAIVTSLANIQGSNERTVFSGTYRYTRIYQHLPSGAWKITNFEITPVHLSKPDQ